MPLWPLLKTPQPLQNAGLNGKAKVDFLLLVRMVMAAMTNLVVQRC
jgi:hypothetical protein